MGHPIGLRKLGQKPKSSTHLTSKEEPVQINEAALQKVKDAKMSGKGFAIVMATLGETLALTGAAETQMSFDYQHKDIPVEPGDLIPFITIGLRQATIQQMMKAAEGKHDQESFTTL